MKITVIKNGPYIVIGGVPLIISEIRNVKKATAEVGVKSKDTPYRNSMLYAVVVTQITKFSVMGHMQRFTLMEPTLGTMSLI